jgi:hypothetical protein
LRVLVTASEAKSQMLDAEYWFDMRQGGSGAPRVMFKYDAEGALFLASSRGLLDPPIRVS